MSLSVIRDAHISMAFGSDQLRPQVESLVRAQGIGDRVHLLGNVSHPELQEIYSAADYFLLGSHHEGSGYALIESLACGATPIVSDIPSFRRITGGGRIGRLWKTENPESLKEAIAMAVRDPIPREVVREHFQNNLSFDAIARSSLDAYVELRQLRSTRSE
ncbi:MAG TPA: glycosyltransferase, partial [Bacteroidota bacterium]|jgi:glycosyltransferase involved in cell wall biosynthesis|nr:glycosyltransferase [Bacteroidota bacterium]